MEFFFYCRDRRGAEGLLEEFAEAHWSFMDGYADAMIARGPTVDANDAHTGSMHIVDLPDLEAAHVFAFEEPYFKAGVYADVLMHRWRNALGRTMWDFEGDADDHGRFLIIGHGRPDASAARDTLVEDHRRYLDSFSEHFIARGPLMSDDGVEWVGSAMLVELGSHTAVEAMLASEPYSRAGLYENVEIHDWRIGGRP
jgi:uncharacterized protein